MGFLSIQSIVPPGVILPYAGSTAPSGWKLCNGDPLSTTAFPELFAAIGYTYGGSGGTFNLPNAQGVFIKGHGTQTISGETYSGARGTTEQDSVQQHGHSGSSSAITGSFGFTDDIGGISVFANAYMSGGFSGSGNVSRMARSGLVLTSSNSTVHQQINLNTTPTITVGNTSGSRSSTQTKPANISANYIIKT